MEPCQPGGLRGLRESRGLTQQELAEAVGRLAWAQNERGVGVNADMISKWERGVKWPSRRYVRLLSDFFGLAVPEFCLVLGSLGSLKTPDPPTAVLSSLSDPASIFGFGIDAMLSEDSVRRRSMLRLMGVVPLSIVLTPTAGAASASPASSPELARSLEGMSKEYQRLYRVTDPAALLVAVTGHLRTVSTLVADSRDRALRDRLLSDLGQVALLAGRLAFFDLGDTYSARAHFSVALEAARETGDRLLGAAVLGHASFVASANRNYGVAKDYLGEAAASASQAEAPQILSWLAAVEGEIRTRAGERDAAWRALDRATDLLGSSADPVPMWFDYYDASRLDGFKGDSYQTFGRSADARRHLERSLESLPHESTKQRAVVLTDLATAHLQDQDVDEACRTAEMAVDALRTAEYATGTDRLLAFRKRLEGLGASRQMRALDERLSLL
ncbi:MAG: helix-turn-helix transcriptional regulator [Dermatophilaceae bacterium]